MDISIFLAKVFGLYFIIMGLAVLKNRGGLNEMISELVNNSSRRLMDGFLILIIGILLVVSHNIWAGGWKILITILGWLTLLKGILRLFLSNEQFAKVVNKFSNPSFYMWSGVISVVLGIYLAYIGFFIG